MWTSQLIFCILLSARHAQQSASECIFPHLKVTEGNGRLVVRTYPYPYASIGNYIRKFIK